MLKHFKEGHSMQDISFIVHTFKEGKMYVAYVPELDLSSCGSTDEEARKNIRDAVRGFVETSAEMGTLAEILKEGVRSQKLEVRSQKEPANDW
jgi:predicted RNase H-like HicB family nuclease